MWKDDDGRIQVGLAGIATTQMCFDTRKMTCIVDSPPNDPSCAEVRIRFEEPWLEVDFGIWACAEGAIEIRVGLFARTLNGLKGKTSESMAKPSTQG